MCVYIDIYTYIFVCYVCVYIYICIRICMCVACYSYHLFSYLFVPSISLMCDLSPLITMQNVSIIHILKIRKLWI